MKKHKKIILSAAILLAISGIIYVSWDKNLPTYFEYNSLTNSFYQDYYKNDSFELETIIKFNNKIIEIQPPRIKRLQKICELHLLRNKKIPFIWLQKEKMYSFDSLLGLLLINEMYKYSPLDAEKKELYAQSIVKAISFYYMGITSNLIIPDDCYSQYAASICVDAMEKGDQQLVQLINDPFQVFNNKPIDAGGGIKMGLGGSVVYVPEQYKGMTTEDYKGFVRLFKLWCWNTANRPQQRTEND